MNSGGSRKTIASAYGNISGSRKQIFPYSATSTYTWNKYSISTSSSINTEQIPYILFMTERIVKTTYDTNSIKNQFTSSGIYIEKSAMDDYCYQERGFELSRSDVFVVMTASQFSTYQSSSGIYMDVYYNGYSNLHVIFDTQYVVCCATTTSLSQAMNDYGYIYKRTPTTTTTKGELIGTVTSSSSSAYPSNGVSGNYWYVLVS